MERTIGGLHIEPDDCRLLAQALRALLESEPSALADDWELVEEIAPSLEQAAVRGDGLDIYSARCAPIAEAIRGVFDPDDIVDVIADVRD